MVACGNSFNQVIPFKARQSSKNLRQTGLYHQLPKSIFLFQSHAMACQVKSKAVVWGLQFVIFSSLLVHCWVKYRYSEHCWTRTTVSDSILISKLFNGCVSYPVALSLAVKLAVKRTGLFAQASTDGIVGACFPIHKPKMRTVLSTVFLDISNMVYKRLETVKKNLKT